MEKNWGFRAGHVAFFGVILDWRVLLPNRMIVVVLTAAPNSCQKTRVSIVMRPNLADGKWERRKKEGKEKRRKICRLENT